MDKGDIPLCIYLDLSKAFDTLNHNILLRKLNYYGVTGTSLTLFESYLKNRKQYVELEGTNSDLLEIKTGVPQGSILGPLLFIIYVNDISNASNLFKFILYADDTTLTTTLNLDIDNFDELINRELYKISDWLKVNELSLNVDKSKFMIFHHANKRFIKPKLKIDNVSVSQVNSFNFLGLTLDENLLWNEHITKISSKISRTIGIINKLKHLLPLNIKVTMYNSLILPYINFGILLWGFKCSNIEKLQKKAIRCITCSRYNAHTEPLFKDLKLLKISDIFTLAKLKFYYKYVNANLPVRLLSFSFIPLNVIYNHSARNCNKLFMNRVKSVFGKQSLTYDIPTVINETDANIIEKIYTHSFHGYSLYIKNRFLSKYQYVCNRLNCYICQNSNV